MIEKVFMQLRIQLLLMIFSLSSLFGTSPEQSFWQWFSKNQDRLFYFEKNQEAIFDELAAEMHKVNKSLTFEFGPDKNGKREFVISADGIKDAFPFVELLYDSSPKSDRWIFIKFRPRRPPMDINYRDLKITAASVHVLLAKDQNQEKLAVIVLFPSYEEAKDKDYRGVAFLLLDQALGEFDTETKVGYIGVGSTDHPQIKSSYSLKELPSAFDNALVVKK